MMASKHTYTNLREALESLQFYGYTANICLKNRCLKVRNSKCKLHNNEFEIDAIHHIPEPGHELNDTGLYAITSKKFNLKGLMIINLLNPGKTLSDQLAATLEIKLTAQS